ncbi:hypothetical protein, partial [Bacillus velezensis]|uniref:hypothetical protein n=1 Tax=Bacillus velezensis TaxID=492670 RepID=UPI001C92E8BB
DLVVEGFGVVGEGSGGVRGMLRFKVEVMGGMEVEGMMGYRGGGKVLMVGKGMKGQREGVEGGGGEVYEKERGEDGGRFGGRG